MKGIPLHLIKPSSILLQNILFLKYFFCMQQPFCWSVLENILIIVIIVFILLHILIYVFFNQIIIKLYVIKYSLLPFCLYNVILKIK